MTIRNIPAGLAQALEKERRKRGTLVHQVAAKSGLLNRAVLALLRNALGVPNQAVRSNGLHRLHPPARLLEHHPILRLLAVQHGHAFRGPSEFSFRQHFAVVVRKLEA